MWPGTGGKTYKSPLDVSATFLLFDSLVFTASTWFLIDFLKGNQCRQFHSNEKLSNFSSL
jgi:hypothetical protein